MNYFIYNGKMCAEKTLVAGAGNRGLRYGDGLFETIKVKKSQIILEDDHFARLWKGMGILQFEVPKHFTPGKLKDEIISLITKNEHQDFARVRLNIFRGDGGLYDASDHLPNYVIQSWALPESNGEWNSNGLIIGIYEDAKKACDVLSNLKHNNYLPYVLAALKAKKEKWNDAIVLNMYGRVCDTAIANIFLVQNDIIITPALKEGCVAGIMRKKVIREVLNKEWKMVEKEITTNDLLNAEEVFLTNSIHNIRWVQRCCEKAYTNTLTKKIYDTVAATI